MRPTKKEDLKPSYFTEDDEIEDFIHETWHFPGFKSRIQTYISLNQFM